jgi:aspartate-semialdehyde dehydrogenase
MTTVAIVGATGAVGAEMLHCLERRKFPVSRLRAFASERSVGKTLQFTSKAVSLELLTEYAFAGVDLALFASSAAVSRAFVPLAVARGAKVIDNSSAFRMDETTPLVVPEVNPEALTSHRGIIANPNCVAALMVMALWPLHCLAPVRRIIASTYQAASGAGAAAMEELQLSTKAYLAGERYAPRVLPQPYAFNLFSHNATMDVISGYNGEEAKVMREIRKIMSLPQLAIGITCVRVPVLRAHAVAMNVEFAAPVSVASAREALAAAPGVRLVDDRERNYFPMPLDASGADDVLVGRVREDLSDSSGRSLALFLSGDQLLKGAALNAVQIAELLTIKA